MAQYVSAGRGGTNLYRAILFFDRVMDCLEIDHSGQYFVFTMDNLNVHHSELLLQRIEEHGHR